MSENALPVMATSMSEPLESRFLIMAKRRPASPFQRGSRSTHPEFHMRALLKAESTPGWFLSTTRRVSAILVVACASMHVAAAGAATDAAAGPTAANALMQQRIAQLRDKFDLQGVWFRLETPGHEPMQMATSGNAGITLPEASISKSVTAIGIALLIQQGRLKLDTKLGDVLSTYFAARGQTLDDSLRNITIERLLTHRAGLQTNGASDPVNGISSGKIIKKAGGNREFFQYIVAANAARSSGGSDFSYSNLSYLILGMVIESVSEMKYSDFCQKNIFDPLGIHDANVPTWWTIVSPFAGWHMSMSDVLRVWEAFDAGSPKLLTSSTLNNTLLGRLGGPSGQSSDAYYTLGVNIRQQSPGQPYVVNHNGIADFMPEEPKTYTFVEKIVPGPTWIIVFDAGHREVDGTRRREVNNDVRAMVREIGAMQ